MIWLALAKRYWKAGALIAVVALSFLWLQGVERRAEQRGYDRATAQMAARVSKAAAAAAAIESRHRTQSQQAAVAWEKERNELQTQVVDLLASGVTVRVCKRSAGGSDVSRNAAAAGAAAPAAEGTIDSLRAGRNIGPELVRIGAECAGYQQQLRALIRWHNSH